MLKLGYVCFTDAVWNSFTNRPGGCGWCDVNHENIVFLQGTRAFEFISSPLMAEALAIWSALLHASQIFIICIKSDCQILIVALSSKRHSIYFYGIIQDIETLYLRFSHISFSFILRSLNYMTDSLTKPLPHSAWTYNSNVAYWTLNILYITPFNLNNKFINYQPLHLMSSSSFMKCDKYNSMSSSSFTKCNEDVCL